MSNGTFNPYEIARKKRENIQIDNILSESRKNWDKQVAGTHAASRGGINTKGEDVGISATDTINKMQGTEPSPVRDVAMAAGINASGDTVKNLVSKAAGEAATQEITKEATKTLAKEGAKEAGKSLAGSAVVGIGTAMTAKDMLSTATTGEGATGNTGTDVASGAAKGAMAGASFPPYGAVVGAVIGGIAGGLGSAAARKQKNAKIKGEMFEKQANITEQKMARNNKIFGEMKADFEKALRTPRRTM